MVRWLPAAWVLAFAATAQGAPRVEMEIALEPGFVSTELQAWHELLSAAGIDSLRLGGGANSAKKLGIETAGTGDSTTLRVFALMSANQQLIVPGGRYSRSDRAKLAAWIDQLKTSGPPRKPGEKPAPFGLSAEQLDAVVADLAKPVDFTTAGVSLRQVLVEVGNRTQGRIVADANVAGQLGTAEKVPGELKGLACGTVVAAVLRREGMALVPRLTAERQVEYFITRSSAATDIWPVGWPPDKSLPQILPELFTLRNVEIADTPAAQLFQVVADRLKLPMLFDEQALIVKKIDPAKVTIRIPLAKIGYEAVLDRAMFQVGLKHEVRVDEAGKPFLWVTAR